MTDLTRTDTRTTDTDHLVDAAVDSLLTRENGTAVLVHRADGSVVTYRKQTSS